MKQLLVSGSVAVVGGSTFTRTRVSRIGRPPCFLRIYRDCLYGNVYYGFADGTFWEYLGPAISDAVAILQAETFGRTFNLSVRRWGDAVPGFVARVAVPIGAELIYSFPPYRNVVPSPCPADPCGSSLAFLYSADACAYFSSLWPFSVPGNRLQKAPPYYYANSDPPIYGFAVWATEGGAPDGGWGLRVRVPAIFPGYGYDSAFYARSDGDHSCPLGAYALYLGPPGAPGALHITAS